MSSFNPFVYAIKEFLSNELEDEARDVFYFNQDQLKFKQQILEAIKSFGSPKIVNTDKGFTFRLDNPTLHQQTAFIIDKTTHHIAAIFIYAKLQNSIVVVHMALSEKEKQKDNLANFIFLMRKVFKADSSIKEINFLYRKLSLNV